MILRSVQPLRCAETGFHAHPSALSKRRHRPVKHGEQKFVIRAVAAAEEQAKYGVLLEVDKALVDTHTQAHRVAFNQAFKELGYKTTWTPEVFWQLLRSAAATPDSLVMTYYNTLGWPVGLDQPQERQHHTERILQKKDEILGRMVDRAAIPLRPGAQEFLTDAILGGATVALLASTCSAPSERIVDAALTALGPELSDNVRIFQCPQSSTSITDAGQSGEEDPPSFEQSLQKATAKRRQEEAQVFLDVVNRSKLGSDWREKTAANDPGQLAQRHVGEGLGMDPSLLVANLRFAGLNPAWLAACCATLDISLRRFALLGGSNSLLKAAQGAGIFSVAVPTYLSGRGSYSADVVADSYGAGGGVTFSKLRAQIDAGGAAKRARGKRA